ncbi:MAG TPA: MMPL family transporter [Verrucomicrobiales bacterium]|nr:MMPL family transporter [Verrucomicrobiales bacterium]
MRKTKQDPDIEWYRKIVLRRGWWLLLALTALAVWCGLHLRQLRVEAGADSLLDENDPALETYTQTREAWGTDEYAIVCVTADDWFAPEGIERLEAIAEDLRGIPHVDSLLSVLDVPLMRQQPDRKPNLLTLGSALRRLGDADVDLERARAELLEHELAVGNLVSRDGRSLSILVNLDADVPADEVEKRRTVMVEGIRKVAATWSGKLSEPVRLSGVPIINVNLIEHVRHDLRVFGLGALILFTVALALVYRSPMVVLCLLLAAALPVLLVVGLMSARDLELTVITANLPLLLFVLTLPYGIYVVERWREQGGSAGSREESESRMLAAVRGAWKPCLFSCLTTLAGFAALTTSGIVPVKTFGMMMAVGMATGLVVVFLFVPAFLTRFPWRPARKAHGKTAEDGPRGPVALCARLASAMPGWVVVASALLLVAGILGALRLNAENKFTNYFRKSSEVYRGLEHIDRQMGGTVSLEVCLRAPEAGFFRSGAGLQAVESVERYFDSVPETGNVRSVHAVFREARKTFSAEAFPSLQSGALIALVDLAAPEMLRDVVDPDYRTARVFVRLKETAPTLNRVRILEGLQRHLEGRPELEGLEVETTGIFVLYANMLRSLLISQRDTILMVVAAVYLMLLLLFRSPWLALLVLLPQALPAMVVLGLMGWTGIPLDLVTVMTGAIAMGVGIDAAIQFTSRYRTELAVDGDRRAALRRTHATIGRAIWIATSVIVAGFAVLVTSEFFPSVWFGLLTGVAMLMSQFAALTTLPAVFLCAGVPRAAGTGVRGKRNA